DFYCSSYTVSNTFIF
nr:immunoglobulin light chain junction region [Macaca mulatta]